MSSSACAPSRPSRKTCLQDPEVVLMLRVKRDEPGAFAELVAHHGPRIFARFFRSFQDRQEAEDLTQDVLRAVVVAALTRTRRGLISELELFADRDQVPTDCVVNFDNVHTLARTTFRRRITSLSAARMSEACRALAAATGC